MKKIILCLIVYIFPVIGLSQHTFSIVAVDSVTGEIGSAGATCLDINDLDGEWGALVISDIILGIGAIHTQAWWTPVNQVAARNRMEIGYSPQEIIDWLINNDNSSQGGSLGDRQYGIVDLNNGNPRTAAYTGSNNPNVANHILGANYAIQGNILLEQAVLDDMESAFLNESGTLADKLMAAMQGAKRVGADVRCSDDGVSSLSAFLRVAQPSDSIKEYGYLSLDINIDPTPDGIDPIDSLQTVYDNWVISSLNDDSDIIVNKFKLFQNYPNPFNPKTTINYELPKQSKVKLTIYDITGQEVKTLINQRQNAAQHSISFDASGLSSGIYIYKLEAGSFEQSRKMLLVR